MSDGKYQPLTDMDDLPRTLRRERESRERAAREQAAREQGGPSMPQTGWDRGGQTPAVQPSYGQEPEPGTDPPPGATVRRIKVPFFSLMGFFIKAVFAAVPALLILIAMLYGLGMILQAYFPQLIKMKILITFPG